MPKQLINAAIEGKTAAQLRKAGWKPYLQVYDANGQPCELISMPYDDDKRGALIQVRYSKGDSTSCVELPCRYFFTVLNSAVSKRRMEIIQGNLCIVRFVSLRRENARDAWGVFGRRLWTALQQLGEEWIIVGTNDWKPAKFEDAEKAIIVTEIEKAFRMEERRERNADAVEILNGMERKLNESER